MTDAPEKISVMQLIYSLRIGGSEKLAMDISLHLDPALFRSSICALDEDGDLGRELEAIKISTASDIGSIKDLVQDGRNGVLVRSGDTAAFAKSLQHLIESPELRQRLGEAGRRTVEASFSLPSMIRTYEDLYHSALRKNDVRY